MKRSLPTLSVKYVEVLVNAVTHQPSCLINVNDLPTDAKAWVQHGLKNGYQLISVMSGLWHYTDMFVGKVPVEHYGARTVIAVSRKGLVHK